MMKSKKKPDLNVRKHSIGANTCLMAVFSGLYESPGPPPSGDVRGMVPPHCDDHQNGHQSGYIIVLFAVLQNLNAQLIFIGASARPMAVFSDLYESPGPPPLGDARSIVPPHRDNHRNGHQSGYIVVQTSKQI